MAHKSKFKSANAGLEEDVPTDDEDTGEIHYIPPEEFEGYAIVDEHQAGPSHKTQLYRIGSESPEIRVSRKRLLDEIDKYQEPVDPGSEIGEFSFDELTPRPSRPLPTYSPVKRRVAPIGPQPILVPATRAVIHQQGKEPNDGVDTKRRRVALTEDEAQEARQRMEALAYPRRNDTYMGRVPQPMDGALHEQLPVAGSSRQQLPAASSSRQHLRPGSLHQQLPTGSLPPYTLQAPQGPRQYTDFPSTLTPELFAEARRMRKAKQELLHQQRFATSQHGPSQVQHPHGLQSEHPATSSDIFYSPTKALPPSRRLPTGQSSGRSVARQAVHREPVAGLSTEVYRKNGSMKGRYPPLM